MSRYPILKEPYPVSAKILIAAVDRCRGARCTKEEIQSVMTNIINNYGYYFSPNKAEQKYINQTTNKD